MALVIDLAIILIVALVIWRSAVHGVFCEEELS